MTEAEWLAERDPEVMLGFLLGRASDRKLRLFACGCARLVWDHLEEERSREAVEEAERFADGIGHPQDRERLCRQAAEAAIEIHDQRNDYPDRTGYARLYAAWAAEFAAAVPAEAEDHIVRAASNALACSRSAADDSAEPDELVALLRDIFGNPFRTASFCPAWRTDTVLSLTRQMYDSREFSPMPILADALQDAGCDNEEVLGHCRDATATHVRGCWVVDLILGKE